MLVISGEVSEAYFGMGYLQEGTDANLDIGRIYKATTSSSALIVGTSSFQTLFA